MNDVAKRLEAIQNNNENLSLQDIANEIGCKYSYLRSQKVCEKPSRELIRRIDKKFNYPLEKKTNNTNTETSLIQLGVLEPEGALGYYQKLLVEKEARRKETEARAIRAEAEVDKLFAIIENLTANNRHQPPTEI